MKTDGGLRSLFQKHLPEAHWQAIESHSTGQGIPDLAYCFKNYDVGQKSWGMPSHFSGWIECKKTGTNKVDIWPEQVAWIERHWRVNGRAWIAVRKLCKAGPRRKAADELHLFHGEAGRWLMTGGLSAVPGLYRKGVWNDGPSAWDWAAVKEVITG